MTLRDSLKLAMALFSENSYAQAAVTFCLMEEEFQREPEYVTVRKMVLPVWGYSHLMSGEPYQAIRLFQEYLKQDPSDVRQLAFVLFSLAQAQQAVGELQAAIESCQRFIAIAPETPEAEVSILRQAELHFECGELEKGMVLLTNYIGDESKSQSLRTQARLRVVQKAQEMGDMAALKQFLLGEPWRVNEMPELAVLAFAALRAGETFMKEKAYGDAIRAYRLVPPRSLLIELQRRRLQEVETYYREMGGDRGALKGVRGDYFRELLQRIRSQLTSLEESEDYTPGWQLQLGQAFLMQGRHREALLLFRNLAEDGNLATNLRAEAHYRWILTLTSRAKWEETLVQAKVFAERYPEHALGPEVLLLVGNAYQEQKNYREAAMVFRELCERYPAHKQFPRWEFLLGLNRVLMGEYVEAREILESYPERHPDNPLAVNAALWCALSYFFERNHPEALERLDRLMKKAKGHAQEPEILYRRANVLYAMKRHDEALTAIDRYLSAYPHHLRAVEALVLRGDILMGKGALLEASTVFTKVSPEAGSLYVYAVFQRGKILRALEQYDLMIRHFQNYLSSNSPAGRFRVAEALHWVGWAYMQKGEWEKAIPVYLEALEKHGNDRQAMEVGLILQGLSNLHRRLLEMPSENFSLPDRWRELLKADGFNVWLREESIRALERGEFTWYGRLLLHRRELALRRRDEDLAASFAMQILEDVKPEFLDAQGLAVAALMLEELGSSTARDYYEKILEEFPHASDRAYAYVGLARSALRNENKEEARHYLHHFFQETPMHATAPEAMLLQAELMIDEGRESEALECMESLLRLRHARGRPHARGLMLMAKAELSRNHPERAIAYYQRVYNSYRGYHDLVATAYLESARLFERLGRTDFARRTLEEMRMQPALETCAAYVEGMRLLDHLEKGDRSVEIDGAIVDERG